MGSAISNQATHPLQGHLGAHRGQTPLPRGRDTFDHPYWSCGNTRYHLLMIFCFLASCKAGSLPWVDWSRTGHGESCSPELALVTTRLHAWRRRKDRHLSIIDVD